MECILSSEKPKPKHELHCECHIFIDRHATGMWARRTSHFTQGAEFSHGLFRHNCVPHRLSSFIGLGSLWLEGNQFLPGLQTISGPINFRALKSSPCSGEKFSPFFDDAADYTAKQTNRALPYVIKSNLVLVFLGMNQLSLDLLP